MGNGRLRGGIMLGGTQRDCGRLGMDARKFRPIAPGQRGLRPGIRFIDMFDQEILVQGAIVMVVMTPSIGAARGENPS